jgi:hypothetical protein
VGFGVGVRRGGRRRRRRAGEVRRRTFRVLAHVKSPETARRGGVRARDHGGKRLGFQTIREAADGYDGWDQCVSVASDNRQWKNRGVG